MNISSILFNYNSGYLKYLCGISDLNERNHVIGFKMLNRDLDVKNDATVYESCYNG